MKIYLDHHSTTPIDPRVLEVYFRELQENFGNPSSRHIWGSRAMRAVEESRETVANLLHSKKWQIYFTSGATESNNLAIKCLIPTLKPKKNVIITTPIEHESVSSPLRQLKDHFGYSIKTVDVDHNGSIVMSSLESLMGADVAAVCIILAHNEFGTIQDIHAIKSIVRKHSALLIYDGAQAVGKIPVNVAELDCDILTFSGHKFYAPKGIGGIFVKARIKDAEEIALLAGGGQEHGMRSGTINAPLISALGKAASICQDELQEECKRLSELRDYLQNEILRQCRGTSVNGEISRRLPGNLSITFAGLNANAIINLLPEIGLSTGSACNVDQSIPSSSLLAIGRTVEDSIGTIRIGLGRFVQLSEIRTAVESIRSAYLTSRNASI
jgi:cysteine desulfurase